MRIRLPLACAAAAVMLSACGSTAPPSAAPAPTTPPPAAPAPAAPPPCPSDSVSPTDAPLIQVQPLGSASPQAITHPTALGCGTVLRVRHAGLATTNYAANLTYGTKAICLLSKGVQPTGVLASRDQPGDFFRLDAGKVVCTVTVRHSVQRIPFCGPNALLLYGNTRFEAGCGGFYVAVFTGWLRVTYPGSPPDGTRVQAGQQLIFNAKTGTRLMPIPPGLLKAYSDVFRAQACEIAKATPCPATSAP